MEYRDLNVSEFADYIKEKGVLILDVRTPEEYSEGHIAGAVNVDWLAPNFMPKVEKIFDKLHPIAIYCRSGRRSEEAGRLMATHGYIISNLAGGILAWEAAGEPVVG